MVCNSKWIIPLFEVSVGLERVTPRHPVFASMTTGKRELSDDVGPCGAMVDSFSHISEGSPSHQFGSIGRPIQWRWDQSFCIEFSR